MRRVRPLIPLLLFLFALLVRLVLVAVTRFDGLYGQDSFAYLNYGLALGEAAGTSSPLPPFAWPIGYPLLVALFAALVGPQALAGQMVSLLAGAAVAPLVYLLVQEARPGAYLGGVVAGLLAAVAAELALYSLAVTSDATGLFWATLSAWLLLRYLGRWQMKWLVAAAVVLALAIMTRWVYGLLAIPWGVAALLAAREEQIAWRRVAAAAVVALLIGVTLIGSQFIGEKGGELSARMDHTVDLRVVRWNPANAVKSSVQNTDGFFDYGRPTGLYYLLPGVHPAYLFPLFTPFLLLGLWALATVPRSRAALLVGWPLTIYLFLAGIAWQNWRFPLALFPPLLVLCGLGVEWAWARPAERWRPLLLAWCLLALLGSVLWAVRDVGNFAAWANQSKQIALSVGRQLPPDATLLAFGLTSTVQHYTEVDTRELFSLTAQQVREIVAGEPAAATGSPPPVYLLVDPDNIRTQWVGKSPALHLAWLKTHTDLVPIARYDPFVLYRVDP